MISEKSQKSLTTLKGLDRGTWGVMPGSARPPDSSADVLEDHSHAAVAA
jgi:hypothetical protein